MTNFNWLLDGSIVGVYLLATLIAGLMVRKYVSRVDRFLVAGREMNVSLGIASLAATEFGIVTCMYTAQAGYTRGFAGAIPGFCNASAMFVVGWTGFCVKPLRDSGATTIPELFDKALRQIRALAGRGQARGGHVHGFLLHAHLGQRDLQRHPRAGSARSLDKSLNGSPPC
ncbi:MAG: hypothetical protein MUF81_08330 [Verrucomicrobia bacterium]|jgi:SSS family solute:Na+ symporter|nr:hypothetical protein [Verrucomicrobiota bacterium]